MAITHEDVQELKKVFDDRYVLQADCDTTQQKFNSKFANDDKRLEKLQLTQDQMRTETKNGLKFNNWLTTAVFVAIIGAVIAYYFMR